MPTACPHVHGRGFIAGLYHWLGQTELAIKLQRAGLNSHGARSFARPTALVDDPYGDALPVEPKSKNQPGRTGSDNENVGLRHDLTSNINDSGFINVLGSAQSQRFIGRSQSRGHLPPRLPRF
ncbi:protein of unknown function [Pseudomonas sp. JV551A1]|nr:protein of unknown function [Pseudomonas sp. JV551A1]